MASRLNENNLFAPRTFVTAYRYRQEYLEQYFIFENNDLHCVDIEGVIIAINVVCNLEEWGLLIDASTRSLKGVLLHNNLS